MSGPTVQDLLRRLIGSAFEAGLRAAPRAPADRAREKVEFQDFSVDVLGGFVEAEVARALAAEREGGSHG